jgi:hypothetical protein
MKRCESARSPLLVTTVGRGRATLDGVYASSSSGYLASTGICL